MFTVFIYADVADGAGNIVEGACIQQFHAQASHLIDVISEGEEIAESLSDLYDHVEFAIWNEKARCIDFRGRPSKVLLHTSTTSGRG